MSRLLEISSVSLLSLMVVGCESGSKESSVSTPLATPVVEKQPVAQPSVKPPTAIEQPSAVIAAAPGLIQSTNPNERVHQVGKGRPDPFALLPGQAPPQQQQSTSTAAPVLHKLPTLPVAVRPSTPPLPTPNLTAKGPAGNQFNPGNPNLLPPSTPISLPQADLAKAITVTGVVQVGEDTEAIVKVPDEATSRYVRVGQWLSNGQVLVKRIDLNQGSAPVVILEQSGVEIARAVGEKPANPTGGKTTSVPTNPPPPPPGSDSSSGD